MKTINSFRSKFFALTFALVASVSTFSYDFVFANDFHIDGFGYRIISNNEPRAVGLMEIADCTEDVVIPATVTYNGLQYIVSTVGMGGSIITNDARITIKSIFIPKTIQVVNMRALSDCPHLCSIVVDEENPYLDSRNDCNAIVTSKDLGSPANTLIAGCQTTTIPNSVTEIGNYAFYRCDSLKHMTVPNGVTTISDGAFSECSSLSSIKLPESLTQLTQQWIFSECTSLKEVFFFAKTPPYIAYGMFRGLNPTIFVPKESLDAYKKALYWQDFDIQAIPYKSQWCDTWNILVETGSVHPPVEATYRYQLAQDIVIGDYTYTAVVSKAINDALDAPHYVAAVRFTDDRKVYIYYDNAEYLLYDFNVQEGEELEVFAGINNYTSEIKTYKCTVTGVEQYACVGCPATITLEVHNHPDDFREFYRQTQWIEGVGDINGFLNGINHYVEMDGGGSEYLLCAHKGDELKYTGPLYEEYGCGDNAELTPEDLFPTLWGLQQTICSGYYGEEGDEWASGLTGPSQEITMMDGKPYLQWGSWYLREENDKILVYSEIQKKDLVLYDFTLELGDTLTTLNLVTPEFLEYEGIVGIVDYPLSDYDYTYPIDTLVVTELSKETLLDGKEYTRWKFSDGTVYVEGIGSMSETFFHHIADHLPVPVSYLGSYLVCVSKNGKLLYQMDDVEMERLGAECLCEGYVDTSVETKITPNTNASKLIQDGQLFILRDSRTYNVMGMEVTK